MSEIIQSIRETDGYEIVTDQQTVRLKMDMGQYCCERAGYFMSEDDLQSFIGAELRGIAIVDTALNHAAMEENDIGRHFEGGVMFVNLDTSKGLLQFVAFNEHNGYYGHEAKVISTWLTHEETL